MIHDTLQGFLDTGIDPLPKGAIALVLMEDAVEVESTLRHLLKIGFPNVIAFGLPQIVLPPDLADRVVRVHANTLAEGALTTIVNGVIDRAPGRWIHYCYNAEYLYFPFCETRSIGEMCAFVAEERRESVLTFVVDLYAADLTDHPGAVSLKTACLDRSGYYALARRDAWNNDLDRQYDFFGGLRWRYEEHIPRPRRRIDRVGIFRASAGLRLQPDHTTNVAELNTYACPWHNSLTACVASFRTAKALRRNPGSAPAIHSFRWHNTTAFQWNSLQLLNLGLMEPGQWF
ncbi:hypothetical protein EU805_11955 [Salipiger sp. IMCC34102]|uniref:hypothetical protein n=1 Tax=Salipiger sp. IMCC34102 TaxID=2510647 RepID=UPI00101C198D|nr:hypothetical protein [Salipiger sp. IMCC34102]RYH01896.1 hypothetical protein EU805_11955 [Salipiger sp. IMCC34102]